MRTEAPAGTAEGNSGYVSRLESPDSSKNDKLVFDSPDFEARLNPGRDAMRFGFSDIQLIPV
jgi:hypothetical protein